MPKQEDIDGDDDLVDSLITVEQSQSDQATSSQINEREHLLDDQSVDVHSEQEQPQSTDNQTYKSFLKRKFQREKSIKFTISSASYGSGSSSRSKIDYRSNWKKKLKRKNSHSNQFEHQTSEETDQTRVGMTNFCSEEPPGPLDLLSQKYESLDYDVCESTLYLEEQKQHGYKKIFHRDLMRWVIIFLIGVLTALTACGIVTAVDSLSDFKYHKLKVLVDKCITGKCLQYPFLLWLVMNALPVAIGSILVTYVSPVASGSGIPAIKCYLNGVKVPEVVRVKTFLAKGIGVIMSVVGGLAVGKEGPMIHCGAVIAAGISQGKSTTFNKDLKIFESFREDREKRDFVSAGAAAGVAAAFGAPVGGVLFSLEEGASFWNQSLTWQIFFCSMISTFTLNLVLSAYHQHPGQLSYTGLLNFGKFNDFSYSFFELPVYIFMGFIGGLLGAIFNYSNYKLTVFRIKYVYANWIKVIEAVIVSMVTAAAGYMLILNVNNCRNLNNKEIPKFPIQFHCPDGSYSVMASLWFNTPEASLRDLFHSEKGTWSAVSLGTFFIVYFILACWTYGLSISSGLFIPSLLVGAAWGRLIAVGFANVWPDSDWIVPGKFALIGAAAMLGGVVRMTLSLTVILIEATGNITFGLPIMITLMIAKWVGDFFTEGLYDIHIQLSSIPFLSWEPPSLSSTVYASEVMSTPVTTFKANEKVSKIIEVLISQPHNGFPVVDKDDYDFDFSAGESFGNNNFEQRSYGRFRGLIQRWQLIVLLKEKIFNETAENTLDILNLRIFRNAYPRYPSIETVIPEITDLERTYTIDLRPIMNPSAYSVSHTASLLRIFRLFRALGLRHLVVVNDRNEVIGIVTRKDLARYRMHFHKGKVFLQELQISFN